MVDEATPLFYTRYGFTRPASGDALLAVEPVPELLRAGVLRATVIASAVDLAAGIVTREAAGDDSTFTLDLSLRIPQPGAPERLEATASPLRTGRRFVTTAVRVEAGGALYAFGESTFMRVEHVGPPRDVARLSIPATIPWHPPERPLDLEAGVVTRDAATGHVELGLRPALMNPEGALQGALVALVIECAALALAESAGLGPCAVSALDLRYLGPVSEGPVVSRASWLDSHRKEVIRVELHDEGRARRTSTAIVHVTRAIDLGDHRAS